MSVILAPAVVERLQLARFELEDGRSELAALTDAGAYKAIKSFHDALETFALGLVEHVGLEFKHRDFHKYPGDLTAKTGTAFKHSAIFRSVNDLRTPAKHSGLYPRAEAVRTISEKLDAVYDDNAREYLGLSFFEVGMASTVSDPAVHAEIAAAEEATAKGDYSGVLAAARAAYELLMEYEIAERRGKPLISGRLESYALKMHPLLASELRDINGAFEELRNRMTLLELGFDLTAHARFIAITPNVNLTSSSARSDQRDRQPS